MLSYVFLSHSSILNPSGSKYVGFLISLVFFIDFRAATNSNKLNNHWHFQQKRQDFLDGGRRCPRSRKHRNWVEGTHRFCRVLVVRSIVVTDMPMFHFFILQRIGIRRVSRMFCQALWQRALFPDWGLGRFITWEFLPKTRWASLRRAKFCSSLPMVRNLVEHPGT